jgi:hypothetical protein
MHSNELLILILIHSGGQRRAIANDNSSVGSTWSVATYSSMSRTGPGLMRQNQLGTGCAIDKQPAREAHLLAIFASYFDRLVQAIVHLHHDK